MVLDWMLIGLPRDESSEEWHYGSWVPKGMGLMNIYGSESAPDVIRHEHFMQY
jgi:hypothetical protein